MEPGEPSFNRVYGAYSVFFLLFHNHEKNVPLRRVKLKTHVDTVESNSSFLYSKRCFVREVNLLRRVAEPGCWKRRGRLAPPDYPAPGDNVAAEHRGRGAVRAAKDQPRHGLGQLRRWGHHGRVRLKNKDKRKKKNSKDDRGKKNISFFFIIPINPMTNWESPLVA